MNRFRGERLEGRVISVHAGDNEDLSKSTLQSISANIEGITGDKHSGKSREAWHGEWLEKGAVRRNERQWSGVSAEELVHISRQLDLVEPLSAETVGANLCVSGIPEFSLLPKGTLLVFPSGAVLNIEEYNPPCVDMGKEIASKYTTRSGEPLKPRDWLRPASGRRGVVGVVEVPGEICVGDEVEVRVYQTPDITMF